MKLIESNRIESSQCRFIHTRTFNHYFSSFFFCPRVSFFILLVFQPIFHVMVASAFESAARCFSSVVYTNGSSAHNKKYTNNSIYTKSIGILTSAPWLTSAHFCSASSADADAVRVGRRPRDDGADVRRVNERPSLRWGERLVRVEIEEDNILKYRDWNIEVESGRGCFGGRESGKGRRKGEEPNMDTCVDASTQFFFIVSECW